MCINIPPVLQYLFSFLVVIFVFSLTVSLTLHASAAEGHPGQPALLSETPTLLQFKEKLILFLKQDYI